MSKTYTLLLNSTNATNVTSSPNIVEYTYYVNWRAMLPDKYEEFDLSYQFRSITATTDPVNTVILSVNMGTTSMYDQTGSQSSVIGTIIPKSYVTGTTPNFYYESNNTDDCGFIVKYPTNSYVKVGITQLNGTPTTNFPAGYILQLCFTVIE